VPLFLFEIFPSSSKPSNACSLLPSTSNDIHGKRSSTQPSAIEFEVTHETDNAEEHEEDGKDSAALCMRHSLQWRAVLGAVNVVLLGPMLA
jgi:hypothetical protein